MVQCPAQHKPCHHAVCHTGDWVQQLLLPAHLSKTVSAIDLCHACVVSPSKRGCVHALQCGTQVLAPLASSRSPSCWGCPLLQAQQQLQLGRQHQVWQGSLARLLQVVCSCPPCGRTCCNREEPLGRWTRVPLESWKQQVSQPVVLPYQPHEQPADASRKMQHLIVCLRMCNNCLRAATSQGRAMITCRQS
jgi:hypothetical protein